MIDTKGKLCQRKHLDSGLGEESQGVLSIIRYHTRNKVPSSRNSTMLSKGVQVLEQSGRHVRLVCISEHKRTYKY